MNHNFANKLTYSKMIRNRKYEQDYYRKKSEEENNSFLDKNN